MLLAASLIDADMLRPDTEHDLGSGRDGRTRRIGIDRQIDAADMHHLAPAALLHRATEEVHRGRADEAGDEEVLRLGVDRHRIGKLLDDAALHDGDPVGERQRLDLVVGHVDHRVLQRLVQPLDLDAQLRAQLGVEVRERLVEEEDIDIAHQCPADGDALALAAGKRCRLSLEKRLDLQDLGGAGHPLVDLGLRHLGHLQAEGEVLLHRHLRIERIGLEHHADAAVLGLFPSDVLALDEDLPVGDLQQPGNAVQERRLATAGRAEQHEELAVLDFEVEMFEHRHGAEIEERSWMDTLDVMEDQPFTAPAAMPRTKRRPETK